MVITHPHWKANTWKAFYETHEQKGDLDLHLQNYAALSAAGETAQESFQAMASEPGLTFLALAPNKNELQLFHQLTAIGGTIANRDRVFAALLGFDCNAVPVEIDLATWVEVDTHVPSWNDFDTLPDIDAAAAFSALALHPNAGPHPVLHCKNIIPIPPALAEVFMNTPEKDPASIGVAFISAISTLDASSQDIEDQDPFPENCARIVQFVWAASKDRVTPLTCSPSFKPVVTQWSSRIHDSNIISPNTPATGAQGAAPPAMTQQFYDQSIKVFERIQENLEANSSKLLEDKEKKNPGFKKLSESAQRMILNATELNQTLPPTEPTPTYKKLLEQTTTSHARTYLEDELTDRLCCFQVHQALATAFHSAQLLYKRPEVPSNLSVFMFGMIQPLTSRKELDSLECHAQAIDGNGLSKSDIQEAMKYEIQTPTNLLEFMEMLQNLYAVLGLLFGQNSPLASALKSWILHVTSNKATYLTRQATKPSYLTMALYKLDVAIQSYLLECKTKRNRTEVDESLLDFKLSQASIKSGEFSIDLPEVLLQKPLGLPKVSPDKRRLDDNHHHDNDRGDEKNPRKKKVQNPKPIKKWLLREGEDYQQVFGKNASSVPTVDGKDLCLRWFCLGFCYKDCTRSHKITGSAFKAVDAFIHSCRDDGKGANRNERKDFQEGAGEKD